MNKWSARTAPPVGGATVCPAACCSLRPCPDCELGCLLIQPSHIQSPAACVPRPPNSHLLCRALRRPFVLTRAPTFVQNLAEGKRLLKFEKSTYEADKSLKRM
jgi:hypothetical protein